MKVESFTLEQLELNGEAVELIGQGELTVNVQYRHSKVPGLQAWIVTAVLNGSQTHRFLPTGQPLTMQTKTNEGIEMSGQVYPHQIDDNGGSTSVDLQGSGNLDGYGPKPTA